MSIRIAPSTVYPMPKVVPVKFGEQNKDYFDKPIEVKLDGFPFGSHHTFEREAHEKGVDVPLQLLSGGKYTASLKGAKDLETDQWLTREQAVEKLGDLVIEGKKP